MCPPTRRHFVLELIPLVKGGALFLSPLDANPQFALFYAEITLAGSSDPGHIFDSASSPGLAFPRRALCLREAYRLELCEINNRQA